MSGSSLRMRRDHYIHWWGGCFVKSALVGLPPLQHILTLSIICRLNCKRIFMCLYIRPGWLIWNPFSLWYLSFCIQMFQGCTNTYWTLGKSWDYEDTEMISANFHLLTIDPPNDESPNFGSNEGKLVFCDHYNNNKYFISLGSFRFQILVILRYTDKRWVWWRRKSAPDIQPGN